MRLASLSIVALSLAAVMAGCSSTTSDGGTGGTNNQAPAYTPKGNSKAINEADACKVLGDAIDAKATELGCTITRQACPTYIQMSVPGNEACLLYDEGTVNGCKDFYKGFESCDDFANRPCIIGYFKGSAPQGCPKDAGADVTPTDSGSEAAADSEASETSTDDAAPQDDALPGDAPIVVDAAVVDSASD